MGHPFRGGLGIRSWTVVALLVMAILAAGATGSSIAAQEQPLKLKLPKLAVVDIPFTVDIYVPRLAPTDTLTYTLRLLDGSGRTLEGRSRRGRLIGPGPLSVTAMALPAAGQYQVLVRIGSQQVSAPLRALPGFLTVLPPFLAILMALLFRQVMIALATGIWLGALFVTGYNPWLAFLRMIDYFILNALADRDNASVILFTLILGGMVGVISRNGGVYGIVDRVSRWASSPRSGQVVTWLMGLVIFFDDYTNTLVVGNTMRPVTDRLKISREKLSYIVDSTAAPVASVALISGWIGFEVGLIGDALAAVNLDYNAYQIFVETIPYRFYPLLALVFGFLVATGGRDFGPMFKAERRSRTTGKLLADNAVPLASQDQNLAPDNGGSSHWLNAMIPILMIIGMTFWGLWYTGHQALVAGGGDLHSVSLWTIIGQGNAYISLLWGALLGGLVAIVMTLSQRLLGLSECLDAWIAGVKSMILAIIILVMAWSIGSVCQEIKTADYIIKSTTGILSSHYLPVLTFFIAALVSFATGTSWGTMAILMPLVVPLSVGLSNDAGISGQAAYVLLLGTISSVLSGAVWGDHCSPISDTTIMSSMASGADHVDHVRTQVPYALLVGGVGMAVGDIPSAYGLSPWISLVIGGLVLFVVLRLIGKRVDGCLENEE